MSRVESRQVEEEDSGRADQLPSSKGREVPVSPLEFVKDSSFTNLGAGSVCGGVHGATMEGCSDPSRPCGKRALTQSRVCTPGPLHSFVHAKSATLRWHCRYPGGPVISKGLLCMAGGIAA